ncbi:MAG: preprotein translocase subunit SecE [Bacilli bacterium]|jgi:preprotein translocase SecE subunit|nr:preprotein translocase subunit SecE [Bacilli bacterium]MDY0064150.1 preprotein translocase subunit SecE [Bacilli bacterium]
MSEEKKPNRLLMVFTKEYKHESLILLFLALVAIILGVLFLNGVLNADGVFLIGDYPQVFAWVLIVLGALSVLLAVWPYYKPSIEEVRRVSWPTRGIMLQNSLTVFLFSLILSVFFALSDNIIKLIFGL